MRKSRHPMLSASIETPNFRFIQRLKLNLQCNHRREIQKNCRQPPQFYSNIQLRWINFVVINREILRMNFNVRNIKMVEVNLLWKSFLRGPSSRRKANVEKVFRCRRYKRRFTLSGRPPEQADRRAALSRGYIAWISHTLWWMSHWNYAQRMCKYNRVEWLYGAGAADLNRYKCHFTHRHRQCCCPSVWSNRILLFVALRISGAEQNGKFRAGIIEFSNKIYCLCGCANNDDVRRAEITGHKPNDLCSIMQHDVFFSGILLDRWKVDCYVQDAHTAVQDNGHAEPHIILFLVYAKQIWWWHWWIWFCFLHWSRCSATINNMSHQHYSHAVPYA